MENKRNTGLSTADLASAGSTSADTTGVTPGRPVEPSRTERVEAPQTRVAPGGMGDAVRPQTGMAEPSMRPQPGQPGMDAPRAEEPADQGNEPLFAKDEAKRFRDHWDGIQAGFVDDPKHAVEQADHMVADVMKRLAEEFADERRKLEQQWSRGDNVSTENLRVTLRRYRSFFSRLLSV